MNPKEIKTLISVLGFVCKSTDQNIFFKKYSNHSRYTIKVDFQNKRIWYGKDIKVNHQRVLGFEDNENFVVLECVDRLLVKGYEPKHLELERMFPLGHNPVAGRADITVFDRKGKSLFVVECKTFGAEYEHAKGKLQTNIGQLFTYLQQDRNTRFLCLYASRLRGAGIDYENLVIRIKDSEKVLKEARKNPELPAYINAAEAKDFHRVWREEYQAFSTPNGIFDDSVTAYNPGQVPIKRKDLKPFSEEEGRKFFNEFAEILRHNNISDNSNAFNRILSLVLCKIVDEQKSPDAITEFQIQDANESAEKIQDRLQKLYAEGMEKFLKEVIVYISEQEIEKVLRSFPNQAAKDRIRNLFVQQKFYSNNEFAFKEVHNKRLFGENARVLIEILQLLQYKQFRYERKDSAEYKKQKRYLGEFFELLLDAGYKQTAGQFFTPLPIAKFIVSSLPIREIIHAKIEQKEDAFLPLLIDYACGSGHFLVEAIEEIQEAVDELKLEYDESINNRIHQWQITDWTKGFLYGIEKDYRLARTAKLACFMNGDGETNIVLGDGLEDYRHTDRTFPSSFDILVANPPYSIKDFKSHTLKSLKYNSFDLMKYITGQASEIEVLFVERLGQLLHTNGVCGVILPSSILSNAGIYTKAREVLLRNFEIRAIVELGSNAFMATGTNTITLFLKKRDFKTVIDANYVAHDFITLNKERDNDFADTSNILAEYAQTLGFTLEDYKTFLSGMPNGTICNSDWYKDYRNWFEGLLVTKKLRSDRRFVAKTPAEQNETIELRFYLETKVKEKDKFEFFFLTYGQKTLIVRASSNKDEQKRFLGYEFSKAKGKEGIKLYERNGKHQTSLYDETAFDNREKLNYVIRQMVFPDLFDHQSNNIIQASPLPEALQNRARIVDLTDCFDFSRVEFEKQIGLSANTRNRTPIHSDKYEQMPFTRFATLKYGAPLKEENRIDGEFPVVGSNGIVGYHKIESPAIIVGRKGSMGKVNWINVNCFPIDTTFYVNFDQTRIRPKYLYYLLLQTNLEEYGGGVGVPGLNRNEIHRLKFPVPPLEIQDAIVKKIEAVERAEQPDLEMVKKRRKEVSQKADDLFLRHSLEKLGRVCEDPEYGAAEKAVIGNPQQDYRYIRITDVNGNGTLSNKEFMTAEHVEAQYILRDGDFLFARSGNTVGKTFLFSAYYGKAIFAGYFIRFRSKPNVLLPKFLDVITKSENYKDWVSQTKGGASQPNINATQYSNYQIPLPSTKEQQRVIAQAEVLEKEILEAEARLSRVAEKKAKILLEHL